MQQRAYAVAPSRASSRAKAMVASLPKSNDDDSDAEFTRVARLIDDNGVYHDEETSNWGPEAKRARLACDTKNGLTFPCPYPGCKKEVPLEFFAEHALYDHKADAQSGIACPLCMYLGKGPEYPAPEADLLMHIADAHESDMKLGETKEALKSYAHRNIMSSLNWGVDLLRCRHPPPHAFEPAVPHVGPVCAAEQPPQPPPPPPPPAQMEQQQQQHDEEQNPPSLFARLCDYFISASQVPQTVAQQQQQQQLQQQQQQQQQAPVVVNNGSEGGEKSRVSKIEYELKEDLQSDCMICMGPMTKGESVTRLECMCVFHTECIGDWLKKKPVCPLHND